MISSLIIDSYDLYILCDQGGNIIDVSQRTLDFTQWNKEGLIQRNVQDFLDVALPNINGSDIKLNRRSFKTPNNLHLVYDLLITLDQKDDHLTYQILGQLSNPEPIEQTEKLEKQIELITEGAQVGFWEYDFAKDKLSWNEGMHNLYRVNPADFNGKLSYYKALVHPEDREKADEAMAAAIQTQDTLYARFRVIRGDGKEREIEGNIRVFRDKNGQPERLFGINRDITQQERLLKEKSKQQARLVSVIESTGDVIILVDTDFRIQLFNKIANEFSERFFSRPLEIGVKITDYIMEERKAAFLESFELALKGEEISYKAELNFPNKESFWFQMHYSPAVLETGVIQGVCFSARDVNAEMTARLDLLESEQKFRLIAENSLDLICLHDPDGTYRYLSPSVSRLLGYEAEELLGTNPYRLFHPDDSIRIQREGHQKALAGESSISANYRIRKKSGEYTWFETVTTPIIEDGVTTGLQTASRDVSERKRNEIRIEKEKEKAELLLDVVKVIVLGLDQNGNVRLINQEGVKTLGLPESEILGKNWFEHFLPDDGQTEIQKKFDLSQSKSSRAGLREHTNAIKTAQGNLRIIEWRNEFLDNPEPDGIYVISAGRDITDLLEAQNRADHSEKLYESIFSNTSTLFFITDNNEVITNVNPAACQSLGMNSSSLIGKSINALFTVSDLNVLDQLEPGCELCCYADGDETQYFQHKHLVGIMPHQNLHILSKMTEAVQAQQKLLEQNQKLRKIAWIQSHELRAPVARILGLIDLIKANPMDGEELNQTLGYLRDSTDDLDKIVQDMIIRASENLKNSQE